MGNDAKSGYCGRLGIISIGIVLGLCAAVPAEAANQCGGSSQHGVHMHKSGGKFRCPEVLFRKSAARQVTSSPKLGYRTGQGRHGNIIKSRGHSIVPANSDKIGMREVVHCQAGQCGSQ